MQTMEGSMPEARRPRPSIGRIARRWLRTVATLFVIATVVGFLIDLIWTSDHPFTWRDHLEFALVFGSATFAAFLAVDLRYDRRALNDEKYPLSRKANVLYFVVLATALVILIVLKEVILS